MLNYISTAIMQEFLDVLVIVSKWPEASNALVNIPKVNIQFVNVAIFVQLSSCSPWRVFAEFSSLTCLHAFSNSNHLASTLFWSRLFQRNEMIVQNSEIWNSRSNRIKPAGTRPPQIFVGKRKKKTVNTSPEQNYCSVVLRLKSGKLLKLKAAQLTFYRNQGKTIPLKLSAVCPKNSSCSYLLVTGTLVFRFAFQFYTVVDMYSHDVVHTSACLHHL